MKKIIGLLFVVGFLLIPFTQLKAETITNRLKGKILLQVESHGEAYYVHPTSSKAYYMANGDEAYTIMRDLGIGITTKDLEKIKNNKTLAKKSAGKIFLQVESHGEAYYINSDGSLYYLQNGEEAYKVMRTLGLGVTNADLAKIVISTNTEQKSAINAVTKNEVKPEEKATDFTESNSYLNKSISASSDLILSYSQLKDGNLSFINGRETEMNKYPKYYTYQESGQELVNKVKDQNYLIDKFINTNNNIINELKALINTGKKSSENISELVIQSNNTYDKIILSQNNIKALIEKNVKDLSEAIKNEASEKTNLLAKMNECNDSIKEMNQRILTIKSDYYTKVEAIKKSPISSSIIYGRIDVLTDNSNLEIDKINNEINQKQLDCSVYFN